MSDQNLNKTGNLLRQLREDKNLTQKQLEELSTYSERTISRIELGRTNPTTVQINALLSALGVSSNDFYDRLCGEDMQKFNNDYEEILDLASVNNHASASTKLDELKTKDYCDTTNPIIKQAVLLCEAVRQTYLHENYSTSFDICCEAIQVTAPNILSEDKTVNCEKVATLSLSVNEFRILNIIANLNEKFGQQQQSLDISNALVVSIESNVVDYSIKKKVLPLAYTNFAHRLLTDKSYSKALDVAERGLEFSRKVKEFRYFNGIMCHKGTALYYMDDTEQAKICLKQAYDSFIKHGDTEYAEIMRASAKIQLGIDIC